MKRITITPLCLIALLFFISCSEESFIGTDNTLDITYENAGSYCIDTASVILLPDSTSFKWQFITVPNGIRLSVSLENQSDSGVIQVNLGCGILPMGTHVYSYGNDQALEYTDQALLPTSTNLLVSKTIKELDLPTHSDSLYMAIAHTMLNENTDLRSEFNDLNLDNLNPYLAEVGILKQTDLSTLTQLGLSAELIHNTAQALLKKNQISTTQANSYLPQIPSSSSSENPSSSSSFDESEQIAEALELVARGTTTLFFSSLYLPQRAISRFEVTESQAGISSSNEAVNNLSFYDAVLLCNQLSKRDGLDTLYSYATHIQLNANEIWLENLKLRTDESLTGYRLPTNHEWNTAYYYGTTQTTGFYWDSDNLTENARIPSDTCKNMPCTVGDYDPNKLGVFDMSGNVDEWVMPDDQTNLTAWYDPTVSSTTYQLFGVVTTLTNGMDIQSKRGTLRYPIRGIRLVKVYATK